MNSQTTGTDLKWAILATILVVALIHAAAAQDAPTIDPWEQFLLDLEMALA